MNYQILIWITFGIAAIALLVAILGVLNSTGSIKIGRSMNNANDISLKCDSNESVSLDLERNLENKEIIKELDLEKVVINVEHEHKSYTIRDEAEETSNNETVETLIFDHLGELLELSPKSGIIAQLRGSSRFFMGNGQFWSKMKMSPLWEFYNLFGSAFNLQNQRTYSLVEPIINASEFKLGAIGIKNTHIINTAANNSTYYMILKSTNFETGRGDLWLGMRKDTEEIGWGNSQHNCENGHGWMVRAGGNQFHALGKVSPYGYSSKHCIIPFVKTQGIYYLAMEINLELLNVRYTLYNKTGMRQGCGFTWKLDDVYCNINLIPFITLQNNGSNGSVTCVTELPLAMQNEFQKNINIIH